MNTDSAPINPNETAELELEDNLESDLQIYISSFNPYSCSFEKQNQDNSCDNSIKHVTEASLCNIQSFFL